jgi:hypothetical protein
MTRGTTSGWELPGTAAVWILPLFLPWLALFDLGLEASVRAYEILVAGTAGIAALLGIGLWAAWRTRREGRARRRRLVLWAFLPTTGMLGIATLWLAESDGFILVSLAPFLTWLVATALLPYWRDDEALIDSREPGTGWKRLFGIPMVYADRDNPAVWVRMRNPIPLSNDIGFTPNLGHFWGRLVIAVFFLSLMAAMAVSIVAWLPK